MYFLTYPFHLSLCLFLVLLLHLCGLRLSIILFGLLVLSIRLLTLIVVNLSLTLEFGSYLNLVCMFRFPCVGFIFSIFVYFIIFDVVSVSLLSYGFGFWFLSLFPPVTREGQEMSGMRLSDFHGFSCFFIFIFSSVLPCFVWSFVLFVAFLLFCVCLYG